MRVIGNKNKIIYNSMVNAVYQIVILVTGMILPRYILVAYGSAVNGLVVSIMQFLSITEILTMGLAGAARVELYRSIAYNDIKRTSAIVKAVSQYLLKATLVYIVYMVILLFIYPMFIKGNFSFGDIASLILIIGLGNIITYVCGYAYNVLLDADNTTYLYTVLRIFLQIANVVISIFLIHMNQSIQVVKLFTGVIFAIGPIALCIIVPKIYKLNMKEKADDSWRINQKYAAANSIALIIHDNTDIVLLTVLCSEAIVSVYTVYNLVIKGLKGILSVFTSSMEPLFGNLWAKGKLDDMRKNLIRYEYFIGFFSSVSLSCTLSLLLPFVELYTKGVNDIEYVLPVFALVTILAELARCIRIPYLTVVQAAGKYKETKNSAFIEAGLNITISLVLTLKFGLVGVMVGTLCANLYRTFHYAWYISRHLLFCQIRKTVFLLLWIMVNMLINTFTFYMFCMITGFKITTWWTWIIGAVLIVIISISEVIISSLLFYREPFVWLHAYANEFIKRLKR